MPRNASARTGAAHRASGLVQDRRPARIRISGTSSPPAARPLVQVYRLTRQPHGA